MRIIETVKFDDTERRLFERAYRWATVATSCPTPLTEQELKALARVKEGDALTRAKVVEAYGAWKRICNEMCVRIGELRDAAGGHDMENASKLAPVPLVAKDQQERVFNELAENLEAGMSEVSSLLMVLWQAKIAMHEAPERDDEAFQDDDEFGNLPADAVVVRR